MITCLQIFLFIFLQMRVGVESIGKDTDRRRGEREKYEWRRHAIG
jgi:hypothetical protein